MLNKGLFSSNKDDWETPNDLFLEYQLKYDLDLDVCANDKNYKLPFYFDKNINGLIQCWGDHRVWCNPPYGNQIIKWVQKAYRENVLSNTLVVMLLPSRTDTKWFHDYIYNNPRCSIEFLRGRVKFLPSKNSAPFPSMIVVFHKHGFLCEGGVFND